MPYTIFVYRAAGAGTAILIMELLASLISEPLSRVPFVTSIVLVMALPESAPAQPRAIIGGHVLSSGAGWLANQLFGISDAVGAIAVALATVLMLVFGATHPPAGLDGFLIATYGLSARWIVNPVLAGSVLLAGYSRLWAEGERRWLRKSLNR